MVMEAEASKDVVEKELCHPCSINVFVRGRDNYPLHKPMVYYNHDRVKSKGRRVICDQVHGNLLEGERGHGGQGCQGGCGGVGVHLVCLADGTASDEAANKHIKIRPPKVPSHKILGAEDAAMAPSGRLMEDGNDIPSGTLRNKEASLEIQFPILEKPVLSVGTGEKRGPLVKGLEGGEDKGV
jgi:hypothetical protein